MTPRKRKKLEKAGWSVGSADEFLDNKKPPPKRTKKPVSKRDVKRLEKLLAMSSLESMTITPIVGFAHPTGTVLKQLEITFRGSAGFKMCLTKDAAQEMNEALSYFLGIDNWSTYRGGPLGKSRAPYSQRGKR